MVKVRTWAHGDGVACAMGLAVACLGVASCTVLPVEDVERIRARDSGAVDIDQYAADAWRQASGIIAGRSVSLAELSAKADRLGPSKGNRAGEGSPWSFFVQGTGIVKDVRGDQPLGRISVETAAGPVVLQTGPVVSGTAIRDALPFITFDDVADQTAFAQIGLSLTDRALTPLQPTFKAVRPGDRIQFTGATSLQDDGAPLLITPVKLVRMSRSGEHSK